jgi:glycosyltransferase involved in cell wall biosynthesis
MEMKKRYFLVYYPFPLADNPNSGSKIRPIRMIDSLTAYCSNHDLELVVIFGSSKIRKKKINELKKQGVFENAAGCYMENQTIPLWLTDPGHIPSAPFIDIHFFRLLRAHKIPLGIFYRDVNWRFEDLFDMRGPVHQIMKRVYQLEEMLYRKYAEVCFLPSLEMRPYVKFGKKTVALPPGGMEQPPLQKVAGNGRRAIYVGGISERYGIHLLLDSFRDLNENGNDCSLTLICRQQELDAADEDVRRKLDAPYISVVQASGDELRQYYANADFAVIPILRNEYNDFAIPVKLFEYMSFGLPVVATDLPAQARVITNEGIGIISRDNVVDFSAALEEMIEMHEEYAKHVPEAFSRNTWYSRAETVVESLL